MDCLQWMTCLTQKLQAAFEKRLLFVGLQGSCQRGEATAQSDIDVVVLLDTVCLRELSLYRSILAEMPWNERACGFICGKEEFTHWPKPVSYTHLPLKPEGISPLPDTGRRRSAKHFWRS